VLFISKRKEGVTYFNPYKIYEDGRCEFYITNKKDETFTVKVDREDLDRLIKFNRSWYVKWAGWEYYVCCCEYIGVKNGHSNYIIHYLQRFIMDAKENEFVDHISHDTFDNCKENLRVTTKSNNATHRKSANKNNNIGHRNVSYIKQTNEYWVQHMKDGKSYKKIFPADQFKEACDYADNMREELFGSFKGNS
jgi:hypothetical protein